MLMKLVILRGLSAAIGYRRRQDSGRSRAAAEASSSWRPRSRRLQWASSQTRATENRRTDIHGCQRDKDDGPRRLSRPFAKLQWAPIGRGHWFDAQQRAGISQRTVYVSLPREFLDTQPRRLPMGAYELAWLPRGVRDQRSRQQHGWTPEKSNSLNIFLTINASDRNP